MYNNHQNFKFKQEQYAYYPKFNISIDFACRAVTHHGAANDNRRVYCKIQEDAIKDMVKTGVPACITLAQGILESESGNSKLAQEANNHFGIKCHKEWEGKTFHQDDDARDECFRKYSTVLESYDDHSDFLKTRSRYAFLFELDVTDYKGWAHGLKKAGYATNPNYAHKLIDLIERYNLEAINNEAIARMNGAPANAAATLVRQVSVKDKNVSAKSDRNVTTVINITPPTYYAEQNNVKYVVSKKVTHG